LTHRFIHSSHGNPTSGATYRLTRLSAPSRVTKLLAQFVCSISRRHYLDSGVPPHKMAPLHFERDTTTCGYLMKLIRASAKLAVIIACAWLPASCFGVVTPPFEYDWTGGAPGFSGQLFLNAPSSALASDGGSVNDVLAGSYLTTPLGTFSILDPGDSSAFDGQLLWNQQGISIMWLFLQPTTPISYGPTGGTPAMALAEAGIHGVDFSLEVGSLINGGFTTAYASDDFGGQWLAAPAPEPASLALLSAGAILLLGLRKCCIRKVAPSLEVRFQKTGEPNRI
jgi:hypothetical protein